MTEKHIWKNGETITADLLNGMSGYVDNAGLISAPAFHSLQTQVDNSAVGTNLIQMANTTAGYVNAIDGTISHADSIKLERVTDFIEVEPNQTYCMQVKVDLIAGQASWLGVGVYDGNKSFISRSVSTGSTATANVTDFDKLTMVIPDNAKYVRVSFKTFGNARAKFEKGSVATDWCPNPSEILTKSDYAKIQAAIVALGGSI